MSASTSGTGVVGGLGIFRLIATVITLVVGGGVFTLSGDQAAGGASGFAIMTAWAISAVGVLCLVLAFFALSRLHPELKGGIYSYACAGFGDFLGFNSAWGYWVSSMLTTVSYCTLLFGALAYFIPVFGDGNNVWSIIGASCIIWFCVFLVSRGIKEVAGVNIVVTATKIIPLLVAICAIVFLHNFDPAIFIANLTTGAVADLPFLDQVSSVMTVTIWVFLGVEGVVAISGRAKKDSDVGKATVIAFFCVLALYLMISLLSLGVLPLSELAVLDNPSLAGVLEAAVGPWGAVLINGGVVLSLLGAMLGYTVLSSEVPFEAALHGVFLPVMAKTNKNGAPIAMLFISNGIIQIFLISILFSDQTYQFFYSLSAGMILLPYVLSSAYFAKLTITERGRFDGRVGGPLWLWRIVGVVGVIYACFLAYASGPVGVTIMSLLYLPGIVVYVVGKRQRNMPYFKKSLDKIVAGIIIVAACVSVILFATGVIAL